MSKYIAALLKVILALILSADGNIFFARFYYKISVAFAPFSFCGDRQNRVQVISDGKIDSGCRGV